MLAKHGLKFSVHEREVSCVRWSKNATRHEDFKLATCSDDLSVRVWRPCPPQSFYSGSAERSGRIDNLDLQFKHLRSECHDDLQVQSSGTDKFSLETVVEQHESEVDPHTDVPPTHTRSSSRTLALGSGSAFNQRNLYDFFTSSPAGATSTNVNRQDTL